MCYMFKCTSVLNYQRLTKFIVIPSLFQVASFISATDSLFSEPNSDLSVLDYDWYLKLKSSDRMDYWDSNLNLKIT